MERGRVDQLTQIRIDMADNITAAEGAAGENPALARQYYQAALLLAEVAETEVRPGDTEVLRLREKARGQMDLLDGVTRLTARPLYSFSEGTQLTEVELRPGELGGHFHT
jgi:hypothetical protein